MTTASINNRIQEVTDPASRRALYELFGAVRSELATPASDCVSVDYYSAPAAHFLME